MLHRIELPREAEQLRWAVSLQERLLGGLCDPATTPETATVAWVQGLWGDALADWVEQFCTRKVGRMTALKLMQSLARAAVGEKAAILAGFRSDSECCRNFGAAVDRFQLQGLMCCGANAGLAHAVKALFLRFYDPEFDAGKGFTAPGGERLDRPAFVDAFTRHNNLGVCPYCDGPLTPSRAKVDHFYPKAEFPFLALAPENLVPACTDCNSLQVKGDHPPLAKGAPNEVADWFHPYHRTADGQFRVEFLVPRANDQPRQVQLAANDARQQPRVENLNELFGLSGLWADRLKHHMGAKVSALRTRRRKRGAALSEQELREWLLDGAQDALAGRRHREFSIMDEAWCRAAAAGDEQFLNELREVNAETG